jgi:hypothetical protein
VVPACDERSWKRDDAPNSYVLVEGIETEFQLPLELLDDGKYVSWSKVCGYATTAGTGTNLFKYDENHLYSRIYKKSFTSQFTVPEFADEQGHYAFAIQIISPQIGDAGHYRLEIPLESECRNGGDSLCDNPVDSVEKYSFPFTKTKTIVKTITVVSERCPPKLSDLTAMTGETTRVPLY